jgi:hypothetical protein
MEKKQTNEQMYIIVVLIDMVQIFEIRVVN